MLNAPTLSFTTLGSSNVSPVFGQPVTLTASVRPDNAVGQPTGSVSFYDLSAVGAPALLGTSPVSSGGQATLTLSSLAAGSHLVEAVYSGDSNFVFSLDELTEKVAQANPVLVVTDAGGSFNGGSFVATATVTGVGGPPERRWKGLARRSLTSSARLPAASAR